jgi:hypothetical protein
MEAALDTLAVAPRLSSTRSRISNGKKLLPLTDGRSTTARRFKDLYEDICLDLGGVDMLSEGQKQLIRRASMLSAECERQEAMAARGEAEFDIELYGMLTDRLGRVLDRIGLKRVARPTNGPLTLDVISGHLRQPKAPVEPLGGTGE